MALSVRLGWVAADEKEEPALAIAIERLRHEGEGILLIYDNAVDPQMLGGKLIATLIDSVTKQINWVEFP